MNHNSNEFKKLQDKWYKKLDKSGFEDIERRDGRIKRETIHELNKLLYSTKHTNKSSKSDELNTQTTIEKFEDKRTYFTLAEHFLHEHTFADELEKTIWSFHVEGYSARETVKELKARGIKISRTPTLLKLQSVRQKMLDKYVKHY
jgi:hypothetical protein